MEPEPVTLEKLQRQVRILQAYAGVSLILFAVILFAALKTPGPQKVKFGEIEVGRINVVEPDGKLRLVISNNAQSPGPVIDGQYFPRRQGHRGAGLIFYNDNGDEDGGLTYSGRQLNGKADAGALLAFDQYDQNQVVGIAYSQSALRKMAGLKVWDRPDTPLLPVYQREDAIQKMTDPSEKKAALQKLRQELAARGETGPMRVFVGRGPQDEATITLADPKGEPRIVMSVDAGGVPKLNFLDENGKVIDSLPSGSAEKKP